VDVVVYLVSEGSRTDATGVRFKGVAERRQSLPFIVNFEGCWIKRG
jgi:hypothetical protein